MDRLADHVDLLTGFPFKSASYTSDDSGTRLVRGDNVIQGQLRWENAARWPTDHQDEIDRYRLEPGDVVLAMDRPWIEAGLKYARIGQDDVPALLVQRVARLRARSGLNQGFLFYLIGSRKFTDHVLAVQTGTAVPHISGKQILEFQFRLAPYAEQEAIAAVLGALDDKIEQNRRTARALERLARAIFRAWFVDFEPVKAKAAGATAFPSMPQPVFDSLPTCFVDSCIGPVPEGWEVTALEALVRERKERVEATTQTESIPYVPIDCIAPRQLFLSSFKDGSEAKTSLIRFHPGDILFGAMRPYFHKVCLAPFDGTTRTTCFVLEPQRREDRSYSLMLASHDATIDYATSHSVGSTIPYAKWDGSLARMPCMLATRDARAAYGFLVDPMLEAGIAGEREAGKLAEMRDYLLPKMLAGDVRIAAGNGHGEEPA